MHLIAPKERYLKFFFAAFVFVGVVAAADAGQWTHLAGDSARSGRAERGPIHLNQIAWTATLGSNEEMVGSSCPVIADGIVYISAREYDDSVQVANLLIAFDLANGSRKWTATVEADVLDSFSSPAIDARSKQVFVAAGFSLYAFDARTGAARFQTSLDGPVVNCSPVVTSDLDAGGVPTNRVFVVDFNNSNAGKLYAINIDPLDAGQNNYQPGERVWTQSIGSATNATPAYLGGRVYVAGANAVVRCLNAASGATIWGRNVASSGYPQFGGFYGGVSVQGGFVYAATYNFSGGQNNSGLFKLDAGSGAIQWASTCERTSSIPIVAGNGRIYLSGGLDGFGAAVKLQCFQDNGTSASLIWDTYAGTGGVLRVGGWTNQPVLAGGRLLVGVPPVGQSFSGFQALMMIDPNLPPSDMGFVIEQVAGSGGPAAVAGRTLVSIGSAGLRAFTASPSCVGDLNNDGVVALDDLARLLASYGGMSSGPSFDDEADLNNDGAVDLGDLAALLAVYGQECE